MNRRPRLGRDELSN